jgi:hypothetical protein
LCGLKQPGLNNLSSFSLSTRNKKRNHMKKNILLVVAVLTLVITVGCAKGGNGIVTPPPSIDVTITSPANVNNSAIYPTQTFTVTATISNSTSNAVTWSLTGPGTLTPVTPATVPPTAVYVAPTSASTQPTINAALVGDTAITGDLVLTVVPVTVVVTPLTVDVGENLVQQFTAIAVPDDAPQTFSWTCTPSAACGSFAPGANNGDVAVLTAPSSTQSGVQVTATSTVPQSPLGAAASKVSVVSSRLTPGTYAFQFSGFNGSGAPVAIAGTLTAGANGAFTGGIEDVVINGVYNQYSTVTGSYVPSANNGNDISNNLGQLTLSASGGPTYHYPAVLTASGIIRMIESDGAGSGSGVMQQLTSGTHFNTEGQTYAFGFTGVDSTGNRAGYVGVLPMTPNQDGTGGTITGGLLDSNDNGVLSTVCSSPPCGVSGTYTIAANGLGQMTLNVGSTVFHFDFYVSAGTTQTKTGPGALTLYAISTDPIDATHPAVSGSMVYQVPMTYNNAAFSGTSVSNLTGANANVSLTVGTTDGTSSGTGGAGGFKGTFDQNNNGAIISVPPSSAFSYSYNASSTGIGRYTFQMLGNPTAQPVVSPIPFVLYASGANRGFLLDQSTTAPATVITGTMTPQPSLKSFEYTGSEMPGVYAAATISNSDSSLAPIVQNLLLTSTGVTPAGIPTYLASGIQNPGTVPLTNGTYTMNNNNTGGGTGTITYTSPAVTYVIYAIDANSVPGSNDVITDFMMMGTCTPPANSTCSTGPPSTIIFAQQ